jgi:hypothetical protein
MCSSLTGETNRPGSSSRIHKVSRDQVLELQSELADDVLCGSDARCCVFKELVRGLLQMNSGSGQLWSKLTAFKQGQAAASSVFPLRTADADFVCWDSGSSHTQVRGANKGCAQSSIDVSTCL